MAIPDFEARQNCRLDVETDDFWKDTQVERFAGEFRWGF